MIYNADSTEKLKELFTESVDLTVTSPPYDNLRTYNGTLDWSFDIFKAIADQLYRVTKMGGVVVWVVGDATIKGSETGTSFKQALYFKEIGFNLHDTMIFHKHTPPLTHKRYEQHFEYMFVFTKGAVNRFNPIKENKTYKDNRQNRAFRREKNGEHETGFSSKNLLKIKGNVWKYNVGGGHLTKDKINHPAMFPEALARDHIISWSNEGDTVLDPFMGSGTTGKMAKLLNREFIGIEKDKEYYDLAKNRIASA